MNSTTDDNILQAAERLFLERGFAMTSTTDIAREVGCNQALVYYYYRSKEDLFSQIFAKKLRLILGNCRQILESDADFEEKLTQFVNSYFEFLCNSPRLPFLIVNELVTNERRRCQVREKVISDPEVQRFYYAMQDELNEEIEKGRIRPIDLLDLFLNIMSLTVMNFLVLPLYADFLLKTKQEQRQFIAMRQKEVIETILRSLQNK